MRSLSRLLAAVAVAAAAVGGGVSAPAQAAACSATSGVTVVVDFNDLGGGVDVVCDRDGGGKAAAELFASAGYALTYAARQPGFVCRVEGVPASDPCVTTAPADAYWGLWWSDGETGTWSYSGLGADALTIPEGGYVAFSWDQRDGEAKPGVDPAGTADAAGAPSETPTASTDAAPAAAEPEDGLPGFVAPAVIGVLFGVAGAVFLLRRRTGRP